MLDSFLQAKSTLSHSLHLSSFEWDQLSKIQKKKKILNPTSAFKFLKIDKGQLASLRIRYDYTFNNSFVVLVSKRKRQEYIYIYIYIYIKLFGIWLW